MQGIGFGKIGKEMEFKRAVSFSKDSKNIKRSIDLFMVALEDPNYRSLSVDYLVSLYIKMGDSLHAREVLTKYAEEGNMLSWAKLERTENNYQSSKEYYQKINDSSEFPIDLNLARLEFQLGDYKKGREILETLTQDKRYIIQGLFEQCFSYMQEHNYEKGYEIFKLIRARGLKPDQAMNYEQMRFYFSYFLGKMSDQDIQENLNRDYWIFRLLWDSDPALLKHISHHKEGNKNARVSYFANSLDLRILLGEVRERISELNPMSHNLVDYYKFRMDKPIGYENGQLTNDISVQTILGTDKIISMYPVLLSDEFDRERNGTSQKIKSKRELYRKMSN